MNPRRLTEQGWIDVRLKYETDANRISLRELADKYHISRSTIFKRAARERWKQNAALVEATRKQIVRKMEAKMEATTTEAAELVTKQVVEELRPWIEREKSEHIRRAVAMGKRGFERIGKLWDAEEPVDRNCMATTGGEATAHGQESPGAACQEHLTTRSSQRPQTKRLQTTLPRHLAVAYLFLVRHQTA